MYPSKTYEQHFSHFKERLKERYNLDITEDEYNSLTIKKAYYKLKAHAVFVSVIHRGVSILVIYSSRDKLFKTCLPLDLNNLPVPHIFKSKFKRESFNDYLNNKIIELRNMSHLKDLDERMLFTNHTKEIATLYYIISKRDIENNIHDKIKFASATTTLSKI